jgi:hypothetical protein
VNSTNVDSKDCVFLTRIPACNRTQHDLIAFSATDHVQTEMSLVNTQTQHTREETRRHIKRTTDDEIELSESHHGLCLAWLWKVLLQASVRHRFSVASACKE